MIASKELPTYIECALQLAQERLLWPDARISVDLYARTSPQTSPQRITLGPASDLQALQHTLLTSNAAPQHGAPFRFSIARESGSDDWDAPTRQSSIVLGLSFQPMVKSRRFGWLVAQPPGTPTMVDSARIDRQAWRLKIEMENVPHDEYAGHVPVISSTQTWAHHSGVGLFREKLQRTLSAIEKGDRIFAFGEVAPGTPLWRRRQKHDAAPSGS